MAAPFLIAQQIVIRGQDVYTLTAIPDFGLCESGNRNPHSGLTFGIKSIFALY